MPPRKSPEHPDGYIHYVEPYFGGGSVLLANDPEGISEAVSDANASLVNFWRVLQSETTFGQFKRRLEATPFCETEFESSRSLGELLSDREPLFHDVARAISFFVVARQSLAGRMKGFTGITKTRTRRGMNNEVSAWLSAVDGLPQVHERMKRVLILNRDGIRTIESQDGPGTLVVCDPPYLHETRETTGEYKHEMSRDDHAKLLETLAGIKGRFLLCGYPSDLYEEFERKHNWRHVDFPTPNHASGAKKKRIMTERLWMNYGENGERLQ
ncbi:Dam Site-specific DNA methylase [uncultured Caudovirales phage]|uniref:Dam Site-specific DNA methylase n=1 Tax=uncultured Caudovirales phage TaxID=2100421 RepID=A0A6J5RGY7_9CAUD|nr:Dam Site-specific DNA methylase [uncultured Caudovirales phage]